jgi:hypothetical protein
LEKRELCLQTNSNKLLKKVSAQQRQIQKAKNDNKASQRDVHYEIISTTGKKKSQQFSASTKASDLI